MYNTEMILIIGLGNPGIKYRNTPHNLGFETLDAIKKQGNFSLWKKQFKSKISIGKINNKKIILVKPQTFMNQSGEAVKLVKRYYKIPLDHIWILRDDIDLELGKIRIKKDSKAGGHKGIDSIIKELKTKSFNQLKIGVGKKPERMEAKKFVLKKLNQESQEILKQAKADAFNLLIQELWT